MSITDLKLRKLKVSAKPYKIFDREGLHMIVNPNGSKIWRFKYRFAGKEKLISFGKYPDISLVTAREKLSEAKKLLTDNIDPSSNRRIEKQQAVYKAQNTFKDIAEEWHDTKNAQWNYEHGKKIKRRMEVHLFPQIGRRPISDIKPLDILHILKKLELEGKHEIAHRLLHYINGVFKHSVITGRVEFNPANSLSVALKPIPKKHYPTIKESELEDFLKKLNIAQSLGQTAPRNIIATKLLLLTMLRTGELRQTKWEYINFEEKIWNIPGIIMKMKRSHVVPMSNQIISLLNELKPLSGDSEYILPNQTGREIPYLGESVINDVIHLIGYKKKLVGHGFRSLASTILNENGFNSDAIERQLAHIEGNKVRAAYNRAEYLNERIEMLQWWGDFLEQKGLVTT